MVFRPLLRTPRALPLTRKLLKKFDQNLYAITAATSKLFSHRGKVSETEQNLCFAQLSNAYAFDPANSPSIARTANFCKSLTKIFMQPTPRPQRRFPPPAK